MIISRIHSEVKLRYNDFNTNKQIDLPPAYIDDVINSVTNDYVEIFYSGNNFKNYKLGFEVTQQRIDMLSTLVVGPFDQEPLEPTKSENGLYEFDLSGLKYPYKHLVRAEVEADCGDLQLSIMPHDHLTTALRNPNLSPSKVWKRAIGVFRKNSSGEDSSLYVYTNNEFTISSLKPEYIKKPSKVFIGGYDTLEYLEGDNTALSRNDDPVNSDLPEQYHSLLVDMVVQDLARIFEENNKFNLSGEKVVTRS